MIPSDERMRDAMHSLEPQEADVPNLYERVSRGAKRRRHYRSGATLLGAAAVVAVAALVPALANSSGSSNPTQTAAAPRADIDPGFTGQGPVTSVKTGPATTTVPPASTAVVEPATPVKLPADARGCPTATSVAPGAAADTQARAAALAAAPTRYGADAAAKASVAQVYSAATGKGYGIVADAICGKTLGDNSYVVELNFGDTNSASMGSGQLFVADFGADLGWQVWFQYH
jgi:hypothetical protein